MSHYVTINVSSELSKGYIIMNCKELFLININCDLIECGFTTEQVKKISDIINTDIEKYEVTEACRELATIDTESERMLKMFLATKKIEGCSDKTVARYGYVIKRMTDFLNIPTSKISVNALRLYLGTMEADGKKLSTIAGIKEVLSSYFTWLHNESLIPTNPVVNLGKIKTEKKVKQPYSKVEIEKLRLECKTKRDRAVIEFLNSTACRVGELVKVDIKDIDFQKQECKVLGKGNKERVVFLTDVCIYHLQEYLKDRTDELPALVIGKGTERMTEGGIRFMLKTVAKRAHLSTNVHPHKFRRTTATALINKGMSIQEVAAVLGHVNINTTMNYIYSSKDNVKAAFFRG